MKGNSSLSYLKDIVLNTAAFGLYVVVQQLVLMPVLSKTGSEIEFSRIIFFITLFNILCTVIGDELGNTRLIRNRVYKEKNIAGDFHFIFFLLIVITAFFGILMNFWLGIKWFDYLLYMIVIILGSIRFFAMSYYKLKQYFQKILLTNVFYALGVVFGLLVVFKFRFYLAPFLLGEIFALMYIFIVVTGNEERKINFRKTVEFQKTFVTYGQLGVVAVMMNAIAYLDRVITYPFFGAAAMAVYYSATAMSKMILLVINPISGVILAKFTSLNMGHKAKIVSFIMKFILPFLVLAFFGSAIVSYLGVRFLYPKYLTEALDLFLPISIATSLSVTTSLLHPVIMTFSKTKNFMISNILYTLIFCSSMYFFIDWLGINGIAWSTALGRFSQVVSYLWIITKTNS